MATSSKQRWRFSCFLLKSRIVGKTMFFTCFFAVYFFAATFATLSSCSATQSPGVDSLRDVFLNAGVHTFQQCYLSFNDRRGTTGFAPMATISQRVEYLVTQSEQMAEEAHSACSDETNRTDEWTDSQVRNNQTCKTDLISVVRTLTENRLLLKKWNSTCAIFANELHLSPGLTDNTARLNSTRMLQQLVNATAFAATTLCNILDSVRKLPQLSPNWSFCHENELALVSRSSETYTAERWLNASITQAATVFDRIEEIEGRFRALSFPNDNEGVSSHSNFSVSHQAKILLCYSIFQTSENRSLGSVANFSTEFSRLPLCENTCHRLRNILDHIGKLVKMGEIPMMSYLQDKTQELCDKTHSRTSADFNKCIDFDTNLSPFQRPTSATPRELFCLNFTCPFPYWATWNSHHWLKPSQDRLKEYYSIVQEVLPSLSRPFNGSQIPCGHDCVSVFFTRNEESLARTARSIFGAISVSVSLVAIGAFLLNRAKLNHAARRLNVYLNIMNAFGLGIDQLVANFPHVADNIVCYSDGTLRRDEPNAVEGVTACSVLSLKTVFLVNLSYSLVMGLSHEWYLMISSLESLQKWRTFLKRERSRERIYLIAGLVMSFGLTTVLALRGKIDGKPAEGGCSMKDSEYLIKAVPYFIAVPFIVIYFSKGLPKLSQVYQDLRVSSGRRKMERVLHSSQMNIAVNDQSDGLNLKTLDQQLKLLTAYIATTLVSSIFISSATAEKFVIGDREQRAIQQHVNCMMSRCHQQQCPPLPSRPIAFAIITEVYTVVFCTVFSLWAFNWEAYWKRHFKRPSLPWRSVSVSLIKVVSRKSSRKGNRSEMIGGQSNISQSRRTTATTVLQP